MGDDGQTTSAAPSEPEASSMSAERDLVRTEQTVVLAQTSTAATLSWGFAVLAGGLALALYGVVKPQESAFALGLITAAGGAVCFAIGLHGIGSKVDAIYRFHAVGTLLPDPAEPPEPPRKMNGFAD